LGDRVPLLLALVFGLIVTPVVRKAGRLLGLVDRPPADAPDRLLKIHDRPVATVGGISVTASALCATLIVGSPPPAWFVTAVVVALAVGQIDDVRPLRPAVRVASLVGSGIALSLAGSEIPQFGVASSVAVVVLTVGCANAVNLIDGQDGLAGGLAAIAVLALTAITATAAEGSAVVVVGLAVSGALVAFLVWNRPPATVFLGNGGAYALGVVLAMLAASAASAAGWPGLLAAGTCLLPFAFEIAFTATRRIVSNSPLAAGDRRHSYDRLRRSLGSAGLSTLACCGVAAGCAGISMMVARLSVPAGAALLGASTAAFFGVGAWLLRTDREATRA
jgi:UDP-GlcNAc:undecaprenyl-phosphate GlcNAc-1-phosphate transferase